MVAPALMAIREGCRFVVERIELGPRVDHPHGTIEQPGGERDVGLHRKIELGAETAADRGRHDAYLLGPKSQNARRVVAVEIGRLRAGGDRDAIAMALGISGFRFDIGVFDETGLEGCLGGDGRRADMGVDIAAHDPAPDEDVARPVGMDERRALGGGGVDVE